jgi:hypothetical protein
VKNEEDTFYMKPRGIYVCFLVDYLIQLEQLFLSQNIHCKSFPVALPHMTSLRRLRLQNMRLPEFPTAIRDLKSLVDLDLSEIENITSLPSYIGDLRFLQMLDCRDCSLTSIIPEIGQLKYILALDFSKNRLTDESLPETMAQLTTLQGLYLAGNQFSSIPTVVYELKSLRSFDMSRNSIVSIDEAISNLEILERLYMSENKIEQLPVTLW